MQGCVEPHAGPVAPRTLALVMVRLVEAVALPVRPMVFAANVQVVRKARYSTGHPQEAQQAMQPTTWASARVDHKAHCSTGQPG